MHERIDNDVSCCASVGLYSRCRVVAAANQEPAHKAVSNEDSWNSVDSDRQLVCSCHKMEGDNKRQNLMLF